MPWWADTQICGQAQLKTVTQIQRTTSKYPFHNIPKPDGTTDGLHQRDTEPDNTTEPADTTEPDTPPSNDADAEPDNQPADTPDAPPIEPTQPNMVWFGYDDQGRFGLHADLDAATDSIIDNALTEARDALFQAGDVTVDWTDALLEIAERSLGTIETTRTPQPVPHPRPP